MLQSSKYICGCLYNYLDNLERVIATSMYYLICARQTHIYLKTILLSEINTQNSTQKTKNGGKTIKSANKSTVIISLLTIGLKIISNGNPINDFYWRQKPSVLNVEQCISLSRPIIHHIKPFSLTGKF